MTAALIGASVAIVCLVLQRVQAVERRVTRLEGKIDALMKQAGVEYDPWEGVSEDVAAALKQGAKIKAIKLYREGTGVSLKEAKERIEEAMAKGDVGKT